jgi:hypothetical protein
MISNQKSTTLVKSNGLLLKTLQKTRFLERNLINIKKIYKPNIKL